MKLLIENASDIQTLTEDVNGVKHMVIEGIYMQAEVINGNKRKYPKAVMEKAVLKYLKERVEAGRAWGELGHPATPEIKHDNVSHRITELYMEGNDVYGKAIITKTPKGLIVEGLILSGGNFGVSSRGLGSTKNVGGVTTVQEDFHLATAADIVDTPSAPNAHVRAIMENTEWYVDQFGVWQPKHQELIYETAQAARQVPKARREEHYVRLFDNLMTQLIAK